MLVKTFQVLEKDWDTYKWGNVERNLSNLIFDEKIRCASLTCRAPRDIVSH